MLRTMLILSLLAISACATHSAPHSTPNLQQIWRTEGLANPESVASSANHRFLYVTNVNGEGDAKDGNGFIARVAIDGSITEREWARGLDGPKGVALRDGALYVADIDQLVIVDAASGAVRSRTPAPGARFLNDLAFTPSGDLLIADSGGARIYTQRGEALEIWLQHDLLNAINGFLPEPERLIVTTMQGRLLAIDYTTREISVLAEGLGDADGVASLGHGRYLVSAWPGELFVVDAATGAHERLLDTREEGRFINDILLNGDTLYIPNWEPSTLTAYRVSR